MWQTEIEKLIADLNIAADSVSSQSLSDIQSLLRRAAKTIGDLQDQITWKDVN